MNSAHESMPLNAQPAAALARVKRPRRLLRWAAAGAAVLLTVEIVARLGYGLGNPLLMQNDPEASYLYQPNQVVRRFGKLSKINQYHQRSEFIAPLPAPGVRRVMFLGDSVTFGGTMLDQSETIPYLLADRAASKGLKLETLNASAGNWALANECGYLHEYGNFHSALLVWQIGSNDLVQPRAESAVGTDPAMPDRKPFCALSELIFRYALPRFEGLYSSVALPAEPATDEGEFKSNMALLKAAFKEIKQTGVQLVILHTPNRDEVVAGKGSYAEKLSRFRLPFLELCAAENIPVIDLTVVWRGAPSAAEYFRDEIHLSVRGNQEIAKLLCDLTVPMLGTEF